jgi:hypothetical protein
MQLVSLKRNLLSFNLRANTIADTVTEIQSMKGFFFFINDIELTLYCCNIIETVVTKQHKHLNKKEIVVEIFVTAFGLTPDEVKILTNQIDFLCSIDKVKGVSLLKKVGKCAWSWLERKIL